MGADSSCFAGNDPADTNMDPEEAKLEDITIVPAKEEGRHEKRKKKGKKKKEKKKEKKKRKNPRRGINKRYTKGLDIPSETDVNESSASGMSKVSALDQDDIDILFGNEETEHIGEEQVIRLPGMERAISSNDLVGLLATYPIFNKLQPDEIERLAQVLMGNEVHFETGTDIIKQGDPGQFFYIIKQGEAEILKAPEIDGKIMWDRQIRENRLPERHCFGQDSLLTGYAANATVRAYNYLTCWEMSRDDFNELFGDNRLAAFKKRDVVMDQITTEGISNRRVPVPSNPNRDKSLALRSLIEEICRQEKYDALFGGCDDETFSKIINEMWEYKVNMGEKLIHLGDAGDNLYVITDGEFECLVPVGDGVRVYRGFGTDMNKMIVGELAIIYSAPRAADVIAVKDSTVYAIDRWTFRKILRNVSEAKYDEIATFLNQIPELSDAHGITAFERRALAEVFEVEDVVKGEVILEEGKEDDGKLYILYRGALALWKKSNSASSGYGSHFKTLSKPGEIFGERVIIKRDTRRAATVTAAERSQLLSLAPTDYALFLANKVQGIEAQKDAEYKQDDATMGILPDGALQNAVDFDTLEHVAYLGKGSFGTVSLVKHATTYYALKSVNKQTIVSTGQQEHIMNEKAVMLTLNSTYGISKQICPFVVKLYGCYNVDDKLHFLMEPAMGGELYRMLREKNSFDEDSARFYLASVFLAFRHMHKCKIVYRDLKPENVLIDRYGFPKLTDFGFAKFLPKGKTSTVCGTPDYLAPEIVAGGQHSFTVDYWCLGVFLYEMLAGTAPFADQDHMRVYAKIVTKEPRFPRHFSTPARRLIKGLLQKKPAKRLGAESQGGAKLIMRHPFFDPLDFHQLVRRNITPPYIPDISSDGDYSNFETFSENDLDPDVRYSVDKENPNWDADFA